MVDVETSGSVYGRHALLELGAAVGSRATGVIDRFAVLLTPTSDEVGTSRDTYARAKERGIAPAEAMRRFAAWTAPYRARKASFIARPAAFDWPWIVYSAWTHLGENPFGFKAECASSWFRARDSKFSVDLPHVAGEDAEIQLRYFLERGG